MTYLHRQILFSTSNQAALAGTLVVPLRGFSFGEHQSNAIAIVSQLDLSSELTSCLIHHQDLDFRRSRNLARTVATAKTPGRRISVRNGGGHVVNESTATTPY